MKAGVTSYIFVSSRNLAHVGSNSSNTNTHPNIHARIIKNYEGAEISPYLKSASQPATVSWMLVEDTRLLDQRQRTIYYSQAVAIVSALFALIPIVRY